MRSPLWALRKINEKLVLANFPSALHPPSVHLFNINIHLCSPLPRSLPLLSGSFCVLPFIFILCVFVPVCLSLLSVHCVFVYTSNHDSIRKLPSNPVCRLFLFPSICCFLHPSVDPLICVFIYSEFLMGLSVQLLSLSGAWDWNE